MNKDYVAWTRIKSEINNKISFIENKYFKERDIWWANVGENIGFEEDGKGERFLRPILVLRKFNKNLLLIVPLSKTDKEGKYYFNFRYDKKYSNALLSQIKSIDSSGLAKKIGMISTIEFNLIKEKIRKLI